MRRRGSLLYWTAEGGDERHWSPPTGTKSIAWADAKRVVPWLGTRSAGLLRTSHLPAKGKASSIVIGPAPFASCARATDDPVLTRVAP